MLGFLHSVLLHNQEGANTKQPVIRKLSTRSFENHPSRQWHPPGCGAIRNAKSLTRGVLSCVVYGTSRSTVPQKTQKPSLQVHRARGVTPHQGTDTISRLETLFDTQGQTLKHRRVPPTTAGCRQVLGNNCIHAVDSCKFPPKPLKLKPPKATPTVWMLTFSCP